MTNKKHKIQHVLQMNKMRPDLKGFIYLVEVIDEYISAQSLALAHKSIQEIYESVAERLHCHPHVIERSIRTLLEESQTFKVDTPLQAHMCEIYQYKKRPTVKQVVTCIAANI